MLDFNISSITGDKQQLPGCKLPKLDPWDPALSWWIDSWPGMWPKPPGIVDLLYITMDRLHFNTTWLKELKVERKEIICKYSYAAAWPKWLPEVTLEEDVITLLPNYNAIWTKCIKRNSSGDHFLSTIVLFYVPPVNSELHLTGEGVDTYIDSKVIRKITGKRYSITNFIIDSMSQMNLHRSLPKSRDQALAMGGILLTGHHKVGHNSIPNIMAMMSGSTYKGWDWKEPLKNPLIIGMFRDWGWTTVYFEDMLHWVGNAMKFDWKTANPWTMTYNDIWWYLKSTVNHNNPIYTIWDMCLIYKDSPSFLHIHLSEVGHDSLNMMKNYDADVAAMLTNLSNENALDDTFFILMGDHGYRQGSFARLEQGIIENNMPGIIIIPPKNFSLDHPDWLKNLKANADVLTSHWDIHHMYRDILGVSGGAEEVASVYKDLESPGASLFSPLGERTCTSAGIPLDYCSCPEGYFNIEQPELLEGMAQAVLADMNVFLEPMWGCRWLELANITGASMKMEGGVIAVEATLTMTIQPVQFTMRVTHSDDLTSAKLTRLDRYSKTSNCVPQSELGALPYCICPKDIHI